MKRVFIISILALLSLHCTFALAQRQMSDEDRARWTQRMREIKHSFLVTELGLDAEQQKEFFPIYDKMDDELNAIGSQTRDLESRIMSSENVSDAEYITAARTLFEQRGKENVIEMEYFSKFEKILTPQQLFKLKSVERELLSQVIRKHGRRVRAAGDDGEPPVRARK